MRRHLPSWANDYIGIPFDECDCYDLCRKVYTEIFNIALPDLSGEYSGYMDFRRISRLFAREMSSRFKKINEPFEGCLVGMRIRNLPWHCGIILTSRHFLHTFKSGMNSCIELYDSIFWQSKIIGFFRYDSE